MWKQLEEGFLRTKIIVVTSAGKASSFLGTCPPDRRLVSLSCQVPPARRSAFSGRGAGWSGMPVIPAFAGMTRARHTVREHCLPSDVHCIPRKKNLILFFVSIRLFAQMDADLCSYSSDSDADSDADSGGSMLFASRIFAFNSAHVSGFSTRYCRALSRPCPNLVFP